MPRNKGNKAKGSDGIVTSPAQYGAGVPRDSTLLRATIHGVGTLTSSAGGVINNFVVMDPSALSGTDWADFSSTYDEFRVLGIRVTHANVQFGVAVNGGLIACAFDDDSATAPGSFTAVQQYSTSKYLPAVWTTRPIQFTWWRPVRGGETNIPWIDVANPSGSLGSVVYYCSGLTASTLYHSVAIELFCEFRGRR